jgi:hypothetical protein
LFGIGDVFQRDVLHQTVLILSIGFSGGNMNRLLVSDFHLENRGVETGDHLPHTDDELDWLTTIVAAVKHAAVVESSFVMCFDLPSLLSHVGSPFLL